MKKRLEKWKAEGLRLEMSWVGNGVTLYTCNATNSHMPLGSVWVVLTSNSFGQAIADVVDIYVPEKYRRMGIATHLLNYLLETYGMLRTGTGTKDFGMPLMKSMGWKQNRQTGDWYLKGSVKLLSK